jgi:hypothetical protein
MLTLSQPLNIPEDSNILQGSQILDEYPISQDDPYSIIGNPISTCPNLACPTHAQYNLSSIFDLAATSTSTGVPIAAFIAPAVTFTMPLAGGAVVSQFNISSSSTSARPTAKTYPCRQCGKLFRRRALAEGCENRHQNLRPFPCTKHCGDLNWYEPRFHLRRSCG